MEPIHINGKLYYPGPEWAEKPLAEYLRKGLRLTGVKVGCGNGSCGSCTVVLDGRAVRSCVTPVKKAAGKQIVTIEGLEKKDGTLHPIQKAFLDAGAVQCGFCTPGMILSAYVLLLKNPRPAREEIRQAVNRNLCRCTGYQQIIDAVEMAAEEMN